MSLDESATPSSPDHEPFDSLGVNPAPEPGLLERPAVRRPMVFAALAMIAGLAVGRAVAAPPWALLGPALFLAGFQAVAVYRSRSLAHGARGGNLLFVAIGLIGCFGSNRVINEDARAAAIALGLSKYRTVQVEGRLAEPARRRSRSIELVLARPRVTIGATGEETIPFPLKISAKIFIPKSSTASPASLELPRLGSRVVATGRIEPHRGKSDPAGFDWDRYQAGRGIGATLEVQSLSAIRFQEPTGAVGSLLGAIDGLREKMIARLSNLLGENAGTPIALLLGDRRALDPEVAHAARRSGLAHVLSVSGLHTGIMLALILGLARLAFIAPRLWLPIGIAALALYVVLTGFRPPVVRASIMGAFLLGGLHLGRHGTLLGALAASALVTLLIDPRNFIRADWQLSYLCLVSIILLARPIHALLPMSVGLSDQADSEPQYGLLGLAIHWARRMLLQPVSMLLAILLGTTPLFLMLFQQVPFSAALSNLWVIPAATIVLGGSLAVAFLGGIPVLGTLLVRVVSGAGSFLESSFHSAAAYEVGTLGLPAIAAGSMLLYYLVMVIGPHVREGEGQWGRFSRRQRLHMAARLVFFFVFLFALTAFARGPSGMLELYVLDVGQGDGLVARMPGGGIVVIDAGRRGQGEYTIARFLRWLGTDRIDLLIATHADADHIGGLAYLAREFEVGAFVHGPDRADTDTYRDLERTLAEQGTPRTIVRAGQRLTGFEPVEIEVLNPGAAMDDNNASIVLLLDFDDVEILLAGDIEAAAERRILDSGRAIDIDILKVAHHGSASSTTDAFLDAFDPEIALISVGANNRYGHPNAGVIERLRERGVAIGRTDRMGALRVVTDGRRIRLHHYAD